MILLPKFKDLYAPNTINAGLQVKGFYKMSAFNTESGKTRILTDWFPNLVTTAGLNYLGSSGATTNFGDRCRIGTGSTPPTLGDTALDAQATNGESTPDLDENSGTETTGTDTGVIYGQQQRDYVFPQALTGTFSEVGIGPTIASTDPLFSRALIIDSEGATTTITVLAIEILTVTYALRVYAPDTATAGSVVISGETYNTLWLPALSGNTAAWPGVPFAGLNINGVMEARDGDLGAVTGIPSGNEGIDSSTPVVAAYGSGNFYRDSTISSTVSQNNAPLGIRSMVINPTGGYFQMQFNCDGNNVLPLDARIPKDSNSTLDMTFRLTWAARP